MIGKTYDSRLKNSKRNIVAGLVRQIVIIGLNFVIRTVVLYTLGVKYQGLSGLFTSILQVLNLTELGFSAAVTFALYKPIAEDDRPTICAILAYLKKVYKVMGIVILVAGLAIMPFLPHLIKDGYPSEINIYFLYLIYLANAVVSYLLFAYKETLLTAMQRIDLVSNAYTLSNTIGKVLQIIVLVLFRNYYVYVFLILFASILNNLAVEIISRKVYPEINSQGTITSELRTQINKQVKAIFINKIGDVSRNSFDNIVLSAFVGLSAVAVYDNYYYIYAALYGIMGIIVHSLRASIGNSLVKESIDKNYSDLLKFSFIFMWIVSWCTVCLFVLYQPFMKIWMRGKTELMLSHKDMTLFCLYFYAISMAYTKNAYLEAQGLFHESRLLYILEAVGNLILNIVLCKLFGTTGILVATIVTIFIFNFAGGTVVLFKYYFKKQMWEFALHHCYYFLVTVIAGLVTSKVCSLSSLTGMADILLRIVACMIIPTLLYVIAYCKFSQFRNMKMIIRRLFQR